MNVEQDNSIAPASEGPGAGNELIFVIDDDVSVREGLAELIESLEFRVKAYSSAEEFLAKKPPDKSGCIILDVFMSGMTGLKLQQELNAANIDLPIIFLTGRGDIPMTVHALKAGAAHFLTKPVKETELVQALKEALHAGRQAQRQKAELTDISQRFETLAPREREVMRLVASGRLNKQIAHEMGISERTVKLYRACVMQKMAVGSLAELVKLAEKMRLGESRPKTRRADG
ncbi:MAG TPA: response regulator [Bryobacteraceae bacterium]|nr:response regulator [Bryobacteraceae bacterium]